VALPVERRAKPREPLLDSLHGAVADGGEALRQHTFRLACESLDREVELAGEPPRRLLARVADRGVELLRRCLGVARRLAHDDALQLLDLPALDVAERDLDALRRVVALALDDLLQFLLALAQPVGHLVQRTPPLGSVLLELGGRLLPDLLRRLREVGPEARDQLPLLVDRRLQTLVVLADSRLHLCRRLPLSRLDPLQLVREPLLELLHVARPVREPLLDRGLRREKLPPERGSRIALALGDVAPALLGDPALLLGELRDRVGARPRKRPLELLGPRGRLACDHLVELGLPALDLALEHAFRPPHLPQQDDARGDAGDGDDGCGDGGDRGGGHAIIVGAPRRARRRPRRTPT